MFQFSGGHYTNLFKLTINLLTFFGLLIYPIAKLGIAWIPEVGDNIAGLAIVGNAIPLRNEQTV